jgi:hypothetical protein
MTSDSGWRKLKNKITDAINKDKWDRSCINPALRAMAADSEPEPAPTDMSNFQSQLDARKERLEQEQQTQEPREEASAEADYKQEEVSDLQAGAKYCYYVKIIHESTFPKEGSVRIMRSCDRAYVWTDSISETEIPTCTTCSHCGKPVGHTEVRME